MKHTILLASVSMALVAALAASTGCSSSSSTAGTGGKGIGGSTTTGTTTAFPARPAMGAQMDRIGRPAVNTALNHGFDGTTAAGTAKDAYNQDGTESGWAGAYAPQFEANLAIIDALDGTCGNQLGYAMPASKTSYATLGGALADDKLYLNTAGATATAYLAVEANALGVLANMDQGGRKLDYKVMDVTYSALAAGALMGVSNGITANNVTFSTTFPYEAAPN
jgi:hypothetical protein